MLSFLSSTHSTRGLTYHSVTIMNYKAARNSKDCTNKNDRDGYKNWIQIQGYNKNIVSLF